MMTGRGRARLGGGDPANTRRQASPVTDSIAEYETRIAHQRADKDTRFRASPHSPIPPSGRMAFEGLTYFPMDPAARFEGLRLSRPVEDLPTSFDIATSDGGSCGYSPDYSCPLTPAENRLPERMEAGEGLPVADPR